MGYVYCFANDSMTGILKIGMTERTPEERLNEANTSNTWKPPSPYYIVCSKKVNNPKEKEKKIHAFLKEDRVQSNREFFRISVDKVVLLFDLMAECSCISHPESKKHIEPKQTNYFEEFRQYGIRPSESGRIRETELYEAFTEWFKTYHGPRLPRGRELFEYISKYYENDTSVSKKINSWYGLELFTPDYDYDLI
jgi:hypothetical protein